ncbi:TetR/AcrR family transcriptional regulator [Alkaliphilus serpentinus]|uniref:TetR/AcrR family transcriptional regulator n=1 Tax=Alkaliphilus serpentinus TaxID=1482731 RepID=A0A833HMF0_9FIRM|nr:TetR/AcrR family transcriptional regulator [Alkaliphilus serpentinus]KAB3527434.1 TetR/AcrR family transcriptional regulator [Alkaliphilus serpentinus]
MPKKLFYELDEEKRERITNVVLREFAQHSYNESSTNRIVKNAGIGKGSLFKYFQNKQDMYFLYWTIL